MSKKTPKFVCFFVRRFNCCYKQRARTAQRLRPHSLILGKNYDVMHKN